MSRQWRHLRRRAGRAALVCAALLLVPAGTAAPSTADAHAQERWQPARGASWQWQLSGRIDTRVRADVYDVDIQTPPSVVRTLHARGRKVVCYLSAGSVERYRPDAAKFPAAVVGKRLDGWPDERWLDIRRLATLRPLMAARMDTCRSKGFDGVEADNVDGYTNDSGFDLRARHQLAYNRMLARLAHDRGLAIGLKNDLEQVRELEPSFDFAVNEQCAQYRECDRLRPFLQRGKPVFHAEYRLRRAQFCSSSARLGLSSIRKRVALTSWRRSC